MQFTKYIAYNDEISSIGLMKAQMIFFLISDEWELHHCPKSLL